MSQFVNYNKRGITLPPGCKNLIDVLQSRGLTQLQGHMSCGCEALGKLNEIGKYVAMVFESRAVASVLIIALPDECLTVDVTHLVDKAIWTGLLVERDTDLEKSLRAFFIRNGLPTPEDSSDTGMPLPFFPGAPICLHYRILVTPSDAARLGSLLINLFYEVCGLTDDSELQFRYDELFDSPGEPESA